MLIIFTHVRSSIKLLHLFPFGQQTWPLLLKIEHMVKLHVFGNNSKTVNNIRNLTVVKMISTARSNYPEILKKIWLPILELLPFLAHLAFRPCELLSSSVVCRPSVNISHFNLLLWNCLAKWSQTWLYVSSSINFFIWFRSANKHGHCY